MNQHKKPAIRALRLIALVLGVVSMGGIASATSTMVTCSSTFTGPTELSVSLSCPTFDNLLGTLTGIQLDFSGGITDSITIQNNSTSTQSVTASESSTFNLNLAGFGTPIALFTPSLTTGPQSLGAGATGTFPETSGTLFGSVFNTTVLAPYVGDGTTTYALPISTLTSQSIVGGGGNVVVNFATQGTINALDVIYTYDASTSPVPEPATMGLIGSGLLGLGLIGRRSTHKS